VSESASTTRERTKLVVTVPLTDAHLARLRQRFPLVDVTVATSDDLTTAIATADAAAVWGLTGEQVAAAGRLRWVQTGGAGIDPAMLAALAARGVPVTNNSGVHAINIGEHVLAMMLAFARRLPDLLRAQDRHEWRDDWYSDRVFELQGQHLVVVGLGDLGLSVADRAVGFGMRITGVRRRPGRPLPANFGAVTTLDDLPAALATADHVALCLPLTDRTRGLFNAEMIARTKPGAFLYNVGRGQLVDTDALIAALQTGHLAGAGLDVTDPEPLPPDSPLWDLGNVIITAHTSGGTPHYWDRGLDILETNLTRFLNGQPLTNVVDPAEGY